MKRPSKPWLCIRNKVCPAPLPTTTAEQQQQHHPHAPVSSYIDAVAVEVKKKTTEEDSLDDAQDFERCEEGYDENPLLDYYHEDIIALFYELKDALQLRGMMANSRPEGLVDAITKSVAFTREDSESESSDDSDFDEMEPGLLDVQTGI